MNSIVTFFRAVPVQVPALSAAALAKQTSTPPCSPLVTSQVLSTLLKLPAVLFHRVVLYLPRHQKISQAFCSFLTLVAHKATRSSDTRNVFFVSRALLSWGGVGLSKVAQLLLVKVKPYGMKSAAYFQEDASPEKNHSHTTKAIWKKLPTPSYPLLGCLRCSCVATDLFWWPSWEWIHAPLPVFSVP